MIKADNLYFSYTGSSPFVLEGINFEIKDGEYVSVLGDNGCGKSTLMKLILNLIKPTKGSVVHSEKTIGYVPQKSDSANNNFPITVCEMLYSYQRILHIREKKYIQERLGQVGMSSFCDALVGTLSGGQMQKVLIARALIGNPNLLILDEPSAGVDIGSQKEIYAFLKQLNQEKRITILSVEHNLDAAISNSTLIYHLTGGSGHLCSPKKYIDEYIISAKGEKKNA